MLALLVLAAMNGEPDAVKLHTGLRFTEGPAFDREGNLYFTDIPANQILRRDSKGQLSVFLANSQGCNGLFVQGNKLFAAQGDAGKVIAIDLGSKKTSVLASEYGGIRFTRPNDLVPDAHGGVYFTDPNFSLSGKPQPKEGVYYASADGKVKQVTTELKHPNGIGLSPDGKTLYVVPYGLHGVWSFPVSSAGAVGKGRRLMKIKKADGTDANSGGDGMWVGRDGTLYITAHHENGVNVATPEGKLKRFISVPEQPTNCTLSPDERTLIVTAGNSVYCVSLLHHRR